ncbi:MAG: DHH family phosphoesterase [Planctomycetes bacterium]|nr:DHH family phosphoesterase [Planctomycetota bacterium]
MKTVVLGRGHRVNDIVDALPAHRSDIIVLSSDEACLQEAAPRAAKRILADPTTAKLTDHELNLGPDDLVIVTEFHDPALKAILANLVAQKLPSTQIVFTPLPETELEPEFPGVLIRSDRSLYRAEIRERIRRISSKQKLEGIRRILRERERALIVIWGNPDPDAIASAFGLRELLLAECPDFVIAYVGEYTRPENLAMVTVLKIPTVKYTPDLVQPGTVTITVDAQPSFFAGNEAPPFDIIIDHHPVTKLGPHLFADVRPRYGSTATILTEYYRDGDVPMSRRVATALYYGLKTDTANLTRNVSDADVIAFRHLHPRADANLVRTIELSQLPLSTLDYFQVAIAHKKIVQDTVFSYIGQVQNEDICVHVADFFVKLSGISWVVVACRTPEKIVVIFRADGLRKHAGHVAESLFLEYGTAGGHRTMARAELPLDRVKLEVPELSDANLESWLVSKLATKLKALAKLKPEDLKPVAETI